MTAADKAKRAAAGTKNVTNRVVDIIHGGMNGATGAVHTAVGGLESKIRKMAGGADGK